MKLKNIKASELIIGTAVIIIGFVIIKKFFSSSLEYEINGVRLTDKDKRKVDDVNSEKMIEKLHPKFRNIARAFINRTKDTLGLNVFLTSGYRSFEKQQELYKQNKNNAKPGYSSHNFGFAIDVNVKDKNGKIILKKDTPDSNWKNSGVLNIAKELGMKWGGGGTFGSYDDRVHFFINPKGLSTQNLLAMHKEQKVDKNGYVKV